MIPLVSIPEVVKHYSCHFSSVFSESSFIHFQRYLSGLIVSENKTIEGINRLFVLTVKHQSTLNRFLTDSSYDITALNQLRLELMNTHPQTKLKGQGHYGGVLGLDDTLLIHYGKEFEEIAYLKDHATNQYVWAHNLVNLHYSDDAVDYPVGFELWRPMNTEHVANTLRKAGVKIKPAKEELKDKAPKKWKKHLVYLLKKHADQSEIRAAYRSKIVIGQDLLHNFYQQYPLDIPIAFDKWFTNPAFCQYIDKDLKKSYIGGLKSDAQILLAGAKKITISDFVKQLQAEHHHSKTTKDKPVFGKVTIKYKGKKEVYYNYCKTHHISGYGRQKLLISFSKSDLSDTARVFISNRLKWRAHQLTRVGRHRWPVEEYHKEGKAEGLDKYQTRDFEAISKHIAFVAVVYSILQRARYDDALLHQLQAQLKVENIEGSLAFWRRTSQAQALWLLLQWMDNAIKQGWTLQNIMETLNPAFGLV
jgi:hypothetical protein